MAKAKKLPSGSWRVRVFSHYEMVGGKKKPRYESFTADTKAGAELAASRFQSDQKRYSKGRVTVAEAVTKYIDSRVNVLSPGTLREYRRCAEKYLGDFGAIIVPEVTSVDLQEFVNELSGEMSPKSVKNVYGLVLSAIRQYSDCVFKVKLPDRVPPVYNVPTDAEVKMLMDAAGDRLKLCIALSAFGTLRRGEICGLKYKDVLYDFNAVFVHSDMVLDSNRQWVHKDFPKNSGSIRRVELMPFVMKMIGHGDPEEYIYNGNPTTIDHAFYRLRRKLGLSCRFHDLRHYAASSLHAMGVPDQYIMERGGWSTDATLKAVYRNTLSDKSKAFTQKAVEYYSNLMEEIKNAN